MPSNVIGHERRDEMIAVGNESAMPAGANRASSNSGRGSFGTNGSESPTSTEEAVLALAKVD